MAWSARAGGGRTPGHGGGYGSVTGGDGEAPAVSEARFGCRVRPERCPPSCTSLPTSGCATRRPRFMDRSTQERSSAWSRSSSALMLRRRSAEPTDHSGFAGWRCNDQPRGDGIVRSGRGPAGGYRLNHGPETFTRADCPALPGTARTDRPRDAYQSRAVPDESRVRETGKEIRDRTIEILQRTSFEALVKRSGGRWLSAIN